MNLLHQSVVQLRSRVRKHVLLSIGLIISIVAFISGSLAFAAHGHRAANVLSTPSSHSAMHQATHATAQATPAANSTNTDSSTGSSVDSVAPTTKPGTTGHDSAGTGSSPTTTPNTLSISVSTSSLTFAVGSGSSYVTAKTTDGSSVVWTINSNAPTDLIPHGSGSPAAEYNFYVDSLFATTRPGTYTISVDAFNPKQPNQFASKKITVNLQPQFSFDIAMDLSNMTSGPSGRYIPFHIVTLSGALGPIQTGAVTIDPPGQYPVFYHSTSSAMTGVDHGYILIGTDGTGVTTIQHATVTFTAYSGMFSRTISFPVDLP